MSEYTDKILAMQDRIEALEAALREIADWVRRNPAARDQDHGGELLGIVRAAARAGLSQRLSAELVERDARIGRLEASLRVQEASYNHGFRAGLAYERDNVRRAATVTPAGRNQIALDAAHQIEALPSDLSETAKTQHIQAIVVSAITAAAVTERHGTMTKDQLRRKYIVTAPDPASAILKQAFEEEDCGRIFSKAGFVGCFVQQNCAPEDIDDAWMLYQTYRHELAKYEPPEAA
jgi:hypothetical protein